MNQLMLFESFKSIYYHGSPFLFKSFSFEKELGGEGWNGYGKGIYLTTLKDSAYKYADNSKYHHFLIDGEEYKTNQFIRDNNLVGNFRNKKLLIEDIKDIISSYTHDAIKYPDNNLSINYISTYIPQGEDLLAVVKKSKTIEAIMSGYVYTVKFKKNLNLFSSEDTDLEAIKFFSNLYKSKAKTNNDIIDDMTSNTQNTKLLIEYLVKKGYDGINVRNFVITVFSPENLKIIKIEKVY